MRNGVAGEPAERSKSGTAGGKSGESPSPAWRFQRLLVPAEHPESWPREKADRYLPMPSEEFDRQVAQLRGDTNVGASNSGAQLVHAEYSAQLTSRNTLEGDANWQFARSGTEKKADKSVVVLNGCELPLDDFQWVDEASTSGNEKQPAIVGNDQYGRLAAVVDRAGKIRGHWMLRGQQSDRAELTFKLRLAAAQTSLLRLTLPAEVQPEVEHGLVSLQKSAASGQRQWEIDLGGAHETALRIVKQTAVAGNAAISTYRAALNYNLSQHGLECEAEIKIAAGGARQGKLLIVAEHSLTVVAVRQGDAVLPIAPADLAKGATPATTALPNRLAAVNVQAEKPNVYVVSLPTGQPHSELALRVSAIAPISKNSRFRLPTLQLVGIDFESASARVVVSAPLVLDELVTHDCRQTGCKSLSDPEAGEAIELQFFNEHPNIDLAISEHEHRLQVAQGTSIAVRANEIAGRCLADLSADGGEQFAIEADVAPQWIIDGVESTPPGIVGDWTQKSTPGRPGKLVLQLAEALLSPDCLHLEVTGHRRRGGDALHVDDLSMLKFSAAKSLHRLIQLQLSETLQFQLRGAENLSRLDPAKLSAIDAALLDPKAAGLMFVDDSSARGLSVTLAPKTPLYDGDVRVDAAISDNKLTESYRFRVSPQGREIARFRVRFSQPRAEAVNWTLDGEPKLALSARRFSDNEVNGSGLAGGEVWEVDLPAARSTEFTILASRTIAFQDDTPVALASLIDAESQQGTVEVRATGRSLPEVRVRRLAAVPTNPPPSGQYSTALVALRYLPEEDALQSIEPPLVVAPHELAATDRAWIWQADLESRYHQQGAEHQLTCRIENTGRARFQIQPPLGATLRGAWIDDQPIVVSTGGAEPWRINLPSGARFVTLVIRWSDDQSKLHSISSITPPWPTCDLAILAGRWKVSLPPDTFVAAGDVDGVRAIDISWPRRLLAPLSELFAPTSENAAAQLKMADDTELAGKSNRDSHAGTAKPGQNVEPIAPWKSTDRDLLPSNVGWSTIELAGASNRGTQISIVRRQTLLVWGWSLLVCTIAARWWQGHREIAIDLAVLAAVSAVALLVPAAYSILVGSIWLGFVCGSVMVYLQPYFEIPASSQAAKAGAKSGSRKLATVAGLIMVAVCIWQGLARADETTANDQLPLYRILVPVDANQMPTGGSYYLPERLRDILLRDYSAQTLAPPEYLICRAAYFAGAANTAGNETIAGGSWQAVFEIESLAEHAQFQTPIGFAGSMLVPDGIAVDGKPAAMHSIETKQMGAIELLGFGKHRVEIQFRPVLNNGRVEFAIPKAANSLVMLPSASGFTPKLTSALADDLPLEAEPASSGNGNSTAGDAEPTQPTQTKPSKYWLGPAERISLNAVPLAANPSAAISDRPPQFSVDQLTWFHVLPNSVEAEMRLHLKVQSGRLTSLRLAIDPRWQPIRLSENSIDGAELHHVDDAGIATIEFAKPIAGSATLDIALQMPEASGIGQWRLNCSTVLGTETVHRWCALNVDSPLAFRETLQPGAKTILTSQFLQQWRPRTAVEMKPQLAWQPAPTGLSDTVATWPNDPHCFARYQLAVTAGLNETAFRWLADIGPCDQPQFQYRILVPPELVVDQVVVQNQKSEIPCRWSHSEPGILTVFLATPAIDSLQLQIDGRMAHGSSAKLSISAIRLENAQNEGFRAFVLRHSEVLVDTVDSAAAKPAAPGDAAAFAADAVKRKLIDSSAQSQSDLVMAYYNSGDPQPLTLKIEPNVPIVQSMQATTLSRSAEAWVASVDVDLQLERGIVDTLRFDISPNWTGPFEISPPLTQSLEEVPGETRRQLVLRPAVALGKSIDDLPPLADVTRSPLAADDSGHFHLRITGPLTVTAGQRPSAPDVRLQEATRQTRYFLLPRRLDNQQLSWDIRGLRLTRALPENLLRNVPDVNSYRVYQLMGDRSRASLRSVEGRAGNMQVRQADIAMHWDIGGQYYGAAGFDIEPAGSTACELEIPIEAQLIDARLDGAAAQLSPLGENRWSLWLGLNKLPRHLEVVYVGRLKDTNQKQIQLQAPSLVGLPVERTLWRVSSPTAAGHGLPPAGSSVSPLRHRLVRFQCAAALADSTAGALVDESADDGVRWYALWLRRFNADQAGVNELLSTAIDNAERQSVQSDAASIDDDRIRIQRRLGTVGSAAAESGSSSIAIDEPQLAALAAFGGENAIYSVVRGGGKELIVE
ncbi:MAG TPA: hypothetical protein VGJ15_02345, partial [Pirellulales bacterium]